MANYFDQFDVPEAAEGQAPAAEAQPSRVGQFARPMAGGNFFDKFDPTPAPTPQDRALGLARGIQSGSLYEKAGQAISGRHDPAYAGLPSFDEAMQAENNSGLVRRMRASAITMPTDEAYRDMMVKGLGGRFVRHETDANGYPVVVYRDQSGGERKAYVNKPGLDTEDVSRAIVGAVPYTVGGIGAGALTKGLGLLGRAATQGVAGAGISVAGDVAAKAFGSEQPVDPGKAALMGGLGAAGEVASIPIAALWRKFVVEPGLFDATLGRLTAKGAEAARAAGLDPTNISSTLAREFAKTYAKSGSAAGKAAEPYAANKLGIQSTAGQRSKDAEKLLQEEAMRRGLQGEGAKDIMREFDEAQRQQIAAAAIGKYDVEPSGAIALRPGIGSSLSPRRVIEEMNPADLGLGIREGMTAARATAKGQNRQAWDAVTDLLPTPQAFELLPQSLMGRLGANRVTAEHKITAAMGRAIDDYIGGGAFNEPVAGVFQQTPVKTVDEMRRALLGLYKNAQPGSQDAMLAKHVYDGFNDWVGVAAERQLLSGAPEAAANLRVARSVTRGYKDLFEPRQFGRASPGNRILADVMDKSDSAEGIVAGLFGSGPRAEIKDGSIEALIKMKDALTRYRDPTMAHNAWNDIRAAYWMRLVQGKDGQLHNPKVLLNNIRTAFNNQRSVMHQLYSPQEQAQMREFMKALEQITYKDPNPSGSSYGIATFAKQFLGVLFDAVTSLIPLPSAVKSAAGAMVANPIRNATGAAAARAATSQTVAVPAPPSMSGAFTGLGQMYQRDRNQ